MSAYPIPDAALDDRHAFVGTSGSGKTYASGTGVEKLLARKSRVVVVDPLGVWWGLRLLADGKTPSRWPVVIFGGQHGDSPISEGSGKLVGEAVAGMAESCVVALDGLGTKSAERRFMLGFLDALYRKASGEPVHLVFDEADLWAPQKAQEPQLQALMENIVRRGRVKGFVPWLITQRPAVLSKDVLSQADGLVALKLTSSQDRDALGAWIEGQADRAEEKRILARLPQLDRGEAVIWLPGHGVLTESRFPAKATFDSSRTPKRGERRATATLKPLDLGRLRERLAKVEDDAKANDPAALKAEVARLRSELARAAQPGAAAPNPAVIAAAELRGFHRGVDDVRRHVLGKPLAALIRAENTITAELGRVADARADMIDRFGSLASAPARSGDAGATGRARPAPPAKVRPAPPPSAIVKGGEGPLLPARQKILDAIAWAATLGQAPHRDVVAYLAGVSAASSGYANNLGALRTAGLIDYPIPGRIALTDEGSRLAAPPPPDPPSHAAVMEKIGAVLAPPILRLLQVAAAAYPGALPRAEFAAQAGVSATSSGFANNLGRLSSLGLVTYPARGEVRAADILFPERG